MMRCFFFEHEGHSISKSNFILMYIRYKHIYSSSNDSFRVHTNQLIHLKNLKRDHDLIYRNISSARPIITNIFECISFLLHQKRKDGILRIFLKPYLTVPFITRIGLQKRIDFTSKAILSLKAK